MRYVSSCVGAVLHGLDGLPVTDVGGRERGPMPEQGRVDGWCDYFAAAHWSVAGIGLDIAGAVTLGWSFAAKRPGSIAAEVMLPTKTWDRLGEGFGALARSLARQKAEAQMGLVLLVTGFAMQLIPYLFSDGAGLDDWPRRITALGIVAGEWVLAAVLWRLYVPRAAEWWFTRAVAAEQAELKASAQEPE